MDIVDAQGADLPSIQSIYAHHVLTGTGTFEDVPPPLEEMEARFIAKAAAGFAWLVARDASGILGFGYYGPFRDRAAYRYTVEDSVYVRDGVRGQGVGKALVNALLDRARAAEFQTNACPHRRLGKHCLHRHARLPRLPALRHHAQSRLQIRPLARCGDHAEGALAVLICETDNGALPPCQFTATSIAEPCQRARHGRLQDAQHIGLGGGAGVVGGVRVGHSLGGQVFQRVRCHF